MKKGVKIAIISVCALVVVIIGVIVTLKVIDNIYSENDSKYYECLQNCDAEGARTYAEKLKSKSTYYGTCLAKIDRMEDFLELYDGGKWEEAISKYNTGASFVYRGKLNATYSDCWYQLIIPKVKTALEAGNTEEALELLAEFNDCFSWNSHYDSTDKVHRGNYSNYTEYFPEHGDEYVALLETAANEALASDDENIINLLGSFNLTGTNKKTLAFEDYLWAADYTEWKNNKASAEGEEAANEQQQEMLSAAESGTGIFGADGAVSLYSAESGTTYKIIAAGMTPGGSFGVYMIPVGGGLSCVTGTNSFGMTTTEITVKAFALDSEGNVIQPISISANTDHYDPSNSKITFVFDIESVPKSIFVYPTDDMTGGVKISLSELTPEKTTYEVKWE